MSQVQIIATVSKETKTFIDLQGQLYKGASVTVKEGTKATQIEVTNAMVAFIAAHRNGQVQTTSRKPILTPDGLDYVLDKGGEIVYENEPTPDFHPDGSPVMAPIDLWELEIKRELALRGDGPTRNTSAVNTIQAKLDAALAKLAALGVSV